MLVQVQSCWLMKLSSNYCLSVFLFAFNYFIYTAERLYRHIKKSVVFFNTTCLDIKHCFIMNPKDAILLVLLYPKPYITLVLSFWSSGLPFWAFILNLPCLFIVFGYVWGCVCHSIHMEVRGELCVTGSLSTFVWVLGLKLRHAPTLMAASIFSAQLSLWSFSHILMAWSLWRKEILI